MVHYPQQESKMHPPKNHQWVQQSDEENDDLNESNRSSIAVEHIRKTEQAQHETNTNAVNSSSILRQPACPVFRFSPPENLVSTRIIPNREDLEEEEKRALYYSNKELASMKKAANQLAACCLEPKDVQQIENTAQESVRGMESVLYSQVHATKRAARRLGHAAVLREQELFHDETTTKYPEGILNRIISDEYQKISIPAQSRAHLKGQQDAQDAKDVWTTTKEKPFKYNFNL